MKYVIIGISVAILIAVLALIVLPRLPQNLQKNSQRETRTPQSVQETKNIRANKALEIIVSMEPEKFQPEVATIKKGDAVRFKNNDTQPHWPASNLHPTHGIYPEFDPQEAIAPNEEWNFTFTKVGTWRYHDHLSPSTRGIIEVRETSKKP